MTKADIAARIHEVTGFTRKESADLLDAAFSIMKRTLAGGRRLQIAGFGTFEVKHKKDRRGRNPHTGEAIIIQARRILSFKASIMLRQQLNRHDNQHSDASAPAEGKANPKNQPHHQGYERLEQAASL